MKKTFAIVCVAAIVSALGVYGYELRRSGTQDSQTNSCSHQVSQIAVLAHGGVQLSHMKWKQRQEATGCGKPAETGE